MRKTKKEILLETAAFYNLNNRSISNDDDNSCLYVGPNGKKCAFARVCVNPESKWDDPFFKGDGTSVKKIAERYGSGDVDFLVKEEYKGHSIGFWAIVQGLHDNEFNWNENGLSEKGKIRLEQLLYEIEEFKTNDVS